MGKMKKVLSAVTANSASVRSARIERGMEQQELEPREEAGPPQRGWRDLVRIVSGIGLLIVGIVGLILPIMPGWVFVIPGLVILSDYFPPVKRLLAWARAKYDALRAKGEAD